MTLAAKDHANVTCCGHQPRHEYLRNIHLVNALPPHQRLAGPADVAIVECLSSLVCRKSNSRKETERGEEHRENGEQAVAKVWGFGAAHDVAHARFKIS